MERPGGADLMGASVAAMTNSPRMRQPSWFCLYSAVEARNAFRTSSKTSMPTCIAASVAGPPSRSASTTSLSGASALASGLKISMTLPCFVGSRARPLHGERPALVPVLLDLEAHGVEGKVFSASRSS
jgi:hypothetical protein